MKGYLGNGNSSSHGARPVHLIILMIKWIWTSRLPMKDSLSAKGNDAGTSSFTFSTVSLQGYLAQKKLPDCRVLGGTLQILGVQGRYN